MIHSRASPALLVRLVEGQARFEVWIQSTLSRVFPVRFRALCECRRDVRFARGLKTSPPCRVSIVRTVGLVAELSTSAARRRTGRDSVPTGSEHWQVPVLDGVVVSVVAPVEDDARPPSARLWVRPRAGSQRHPQPFRAARAPALFGDGVPVVWPESLAKHGHRSGADGVIPSFQRGRASGLKARSVDRVRSTTFLRGHRRSKQTRSGAGTRSRTAWLFVLSLREQLARVQRQLPSRCQLFVGCQLCVRRQLCASRQLFVGRQLCAARTSRSRTPAPVESSLPKAARSCIAWVVVLSLRDQLGRFQRQSALRSFRTDRLSPMTAEVCALSGLRAPWRALCNTTNDAGPTGHFCRPRS